MERILLSLSHVLTGIVPFILGTLILGSLWCGVFAVFCVYWSREKTQFQIIIKGNKPTHTVWYKGWFPFEWEISSQLDLYIPVIFYSIIAFIF